MKKSEELLRLENDLKNNEELAKKFELAAKAAIESGECRNDGEIMVKAAKELGYDITISELERAKASNEELDLEEIAQAAGGVDYCSKDYLCIALYNSHDLDSEGHNKWCLATWHCYGAMLHTESDNGVEACWSNHQCILVNIDYSGLTYDERNGK